MNLDENERRKFEQLASSWWDRDGPSRPLHDLNPTRADYIASRLNPGANVLDVGCGGGILTEELARRGFNVTGIDANESLIHIANEHQNDLGVQYVAATAESLPPEHIGRYDAVTCMELLEHVPDPAALVATCRCLIKDDGQLFFSTLTRTPRAYAVAVLGAEYIAGLLPRGTHDYQRFIKPHELAAMIRRADAEVCDVSGLAYQPLKRRAVTTRTPDVNYLVHARAA